MHEATYSAFLNELEKIGASKARLNVMKSRTGRRPISVTNLLKKDQAGTLHKKAEEKHKLHGHTVFQGLPIAIENRKGSTREGVDPDGKPWKTTFENPYGFIKKTEGKDGEEIDAYIGPKDDATHAYVVHQQKLDGSGHDEDKCMLGYPSEAAARQAYLKHYNKVGPKLLGSITAIPMEELKAKLEKADGKRISKLAEPTTGGDFTMGTSDPFVGGAPGRKRDALPSREGAKEADIDPDNGTLYTEKPDRLQLRKGESPDRDNAAPGNKLAAFFDELKKLADGAGSGGSLGSNNQRSLFDGYVPERKKAGDAPSRDGTDVGTAVKSEDGRDFATTLPAGGAQYSSATGAMPR